VIGHYLRWLESERDLAFTGYEGLHAWSVGDLDGFWQSIWDFFGVRSSAPHTAVLESPAMPGAVWFPGATLNLAEHAVGSWREPAGTAIVERSQTRPGREVSRAELADLVARARAGLARLGVGKGDRVAACLPNITETVVAHLARLSLRATWASCAPEFGHRASIDRFAQIESKVLLAVPSNVYGDRAVDRVAEVAAISTALRTVEHIVCVAYGDGEIEGVTPWASLIEEAADLEFEHVPFDHPMIVLFTSGTTGKPKAIVHCHGGPLLEQLKSQGLSWDLREGDRATWFSTTAWMLWNGVMPALLLGAAAVVIDGNPIRPDLGQQWRWAADTGATLVGLRPAYVTSCRKAGLHPWDVAGLSRVRQIGVAGASLSAEGYEWIAAEFGPDVLLNVGSGGTDVCTGLIAATPIQPVYVGRMSGPMLGCDLAAFDPDGRPVTAELGELVIRKAIPSMPVGFWGDTDGALYRATYFDRFPGVWRFVDWVQFEANGSAAITGRSDATLNRGGVRIGTADIYSVVEEIPEVHDSLVVHLEDPDGGQGRVVLFVATSDGSLTPELPSQIVTALRSSLSPRHVPDEIRGEAGIPRSRTGKKLELTVKRIPQGADPGSVASRDSLLDPSSLEIFLHARASLA
jgi:acetoacetyl-CoA synthetase